MIEFKLMRSQKALSTDGRYFLAAQLGVHGTPWAAWRLRRPQASFAGLYVSVEAAATGLAAKERYEQRLAQQVIDPPLVLVDGDLHPFNYPGRAVFYGPGLANVLPFLRGAHAKKSHSR